MWASSVCPGSTATKLPTATWGWCALSLGEAFVLSLGTNGRLQSSGTTASTYLHWCVLHKNKVPDAAAVTARLRCTLLTPEREPRKMGKGVLGAPFSLSPSNHWKFVIGDTKNVVGYTETPQSGQMVRAGLLLSLPSWPAAFLKFMWLSFPFCIHLLMWFGSGSKWNNCNFAEA